MASTAHQIYRFQENRVERLVEPVKFKGTEHFKKDLKIKIVSVGENEKYLEIDLVDIPLELVNALRRVLLSEVPTVAIEKVEIIANSSALPDEVLAHRLGLIPLKVDPKLFEFPLGDSSDRDTIRYELKVKCLTNPDCKFGHHRPEDKYINHQVFSSHIKWVPFGNQSGFCDPEEMEPVDEDILIAKLRPGREINCQMTAVKGVGKDHAKFSPVGTAYYKMHPHVKILRPVTGKRAEELQKYFTPGVIGINKRGEAFVNNTRLEKNSRNIDRYPDLRRDVELGVMSNYFIFVVESVVGETSVALFREAIKVLKSKARKGIEETEKLISDNSKKKKDKKTKKW